MLMEMLLFMLKIMDTRAEPKVCPIRRTVLCNPPALPERCNGAAVVMMILFGVWYRAYPKPHTAILNIISIELPLFSVIKMNESMPKENINIPIDETIAGFLFSTYRATNGDIRNDVTGHGDNNRPVEISENRRILFSRNGNDTNTIF